MIKPYFICVEGVIAIGKTTFINSVLYPALKNKGYRVTIIDEPVDKWMDILPLFYENPERWAYHFQTKVFHDKIMRSYETYNNHYNETDIFIMERSFVSDTFFVNTLYEYNIISDMEYRHYKDWWKLWRSLINFDIDMFIYLKPEDISKTIERIEERNRDGETNITKRYQEILEEKHDEYLSKTTKQYKNNEKILCCNIIQSYDYKAFINNYIVSSIEENIFRDIEYRILGNTKREIKYIPNFYINMEFYYISINNIIE